jgi:hypothetical protein
VLHSHYGTDYDHDLDGIDATPCMQALSTPVPKAAASTTAVGSTLLSFKVAVKAVQTAARKGQQQQSLLPNPTLSTEAVVLFVTDARLFPALSVELIESIAQKAAAENGTATGVDAAAFVLAIRAMAHEHSLAVQKRAAVSSSNGATKDVSAVYSASKATASTLSAAAAAASAAPAASYTTADELQAVTAAVARLHALFEQYELPARVSSFKRGVAHITAPRPPVTAVSRAVHTDTLK